MKISPKIMVSLLVVLFIAAGCTSRTALNNSGSTVGTGNGTTSTTPSSGTTTNQNYGQLTTSEQSYVNSLTQNLNAETALLQKGLSNGTLKKSSVGFDCELFLAQGAYVPYFKASDIDLYVDALKAAGVTRIDIYVDSMAYFNKTDSKDEAVVATYDTVIQHIHDQGLQLVLDPQYDITNKAITTFAAYQAAALPVYATMAQKYHPDVFIAMHEPSTFEGRSGVKITPQQAASFVDQAAQIVKQNSPNTKIGAYGLTTELPFVQAFAALPSVQIIGLDTYNSSPATFSTLDQIVQLAKNAGKQVFFAETWRLPAVDPSDKVSANQQNGKDIGDGQYESLDKLWMDTMALYASANGLTNLDYFWSPTFFWYNSPQSGSVSSLDYKYESQVVSALEAGTHTGTYDELSSLIQQYK